jgi:hypothetical protein
VLEVTARDGVNIMAWGEQELEHYYTFRAFENQELRLDAGCTRDGYIGPKSTASIGIQPLKQVPVLIRERWRPREARLE